MTNELKIINYLHEHKEGTTLDFTRKLWIASPRKVISDIRKKCEFYGLTIVSEKVEKNKKYFNLYRIVKLNKQTSKTNKAKKASKKK